MKDQTQIFLYTSSDIKEVLVDNGIDLVDILQQEGIQVSQEFAEDPTKTEDSTEKEAAAVILASAALVLAITPILSKVISALSDKKVIVKELICIPVENSNGQIVRNKHGEPILQWVEKTRLLESSKEMYSNTEISIKSPVGLEITYDDLNSINH